jgi:uncharacterized membrane protein YhaH (DUF805 family)
MDWYLKVLKNYVGFEGRARRKEYWMYSLINLLVYIALAIVEAMTGMVGDSGMGMLTLLYSLAVLIPGLAVSFRRLHDIDKSAWWLLIAFVPLIGVIVLLVFACMEGTRGDNRFGPDPKADEGGVPVTA